MKKMKKAAALMMTVAMMLSMAACGNSGAKETTGAAEGSDTQVASQAADGEEKTIYIYQMKTEIQDALEKVCEVYSESHPGVKFVCESASDNYATSLKTKFSGGDAPDIFSIQGYSDALVWQSQLADLTGEPFTSEMIDTSAENVTLDGKVVAFPLSVEAAGYVYKSTDNKRRISRRCTETGRCRCIRTYFRNLYGLVSVRQLYDQPWFCWPGRS